MQNIYTDFVSVDKYAQDHLGQKTSPKRGARVCRTGAVVFCLDFCLKVCGQTVQLVGKLGILPRVRAVLDGFLGETFLFWNLSLGEWQVWCHETRRFSVLL